MSDGPDPAGFFRTLSPDAQAAALVYGVVDPHVRTTWQVALILRHAAHQKAQPLVMHYVSRAAEARTGARIDAMTFPYPAFGTMLQGLECCWLGQLGQYTEQAPCQALVGYMDRVRVNGFAWALAECLAVVGQPDLRVKEGRPRPAAEYREEAATIHARLGTRSLTSLLVIVPSARGILRPAAEFGARRRRISAHCGRSPPPPVRPATG